MTSSTGRNDRHPTGAFTLLELIVVLVLISTVLAIAAPSLRGFVRGRQTAEAAAHVLALTHLAQSLAASQGCVHRLNLDPEAGTYWLTTQRAGAFVDIEGSQGRHFPLPFGVSARMHSPSDDESLSYVDFYPDGRRDPATIELTGGAGDVLEVTCLAPTERFRVVSPSKEGRP